MKTDTVKGFNDYLGKDARKRTRIIDIIKKQFALYGFEPAETPIIEYEEFVRGENPDDEAVSNVFKLQDRGKRKLALRYELTFPLKRIAKGRKLPYKRYQIGPVFRDEPVAANRFRQLTQCDVDVIGSTIKDEAEVLALGYDIFSKKLGVKLTIVINNRKLLNEILEKEKIKEKDREQVIREIDKLDKLDEKEVKTNLKKFKAEKIVDILKKPEKYFEKYSSYNEIKELKKYCKDFGIKVIFQPSLARGLSYYVGSVFEFKSEGEKGSICGGGTYLINGIQATGWSIGLARLTKAAKIKMPASDFLIVSLNQDKEAVEIVQKLRKKNQVASIYYGKPSKALEYADSYDFQKVVFVGSKEVKAKKFKVKDMKTRKESVFKI